MLVHTYVCYICWQYQPFWIVNLFLTEEKVSRVLVCYSIFFYYLRTFGMLTVMFGESARSRSRVQLWYNRFKEGREAWPPEYVPTTDEITEVVKQMILNNRRITISEVADNIGYRSAHVKQFLKIF